MQTTTARGLEATGSRSERIDHESTNHHSTRYRAHTAADPILGGLQA
jgi:hypothetical protein